MHWVLLDKMPKKGYSLWVCCGNYRIVLPAPETEPGIPAAFSNYFRENNHKVPAVENRFENGEHFI